MSMQIHHQFLAEKLEPVVRQKGDKWQLCKVETGEESKTQQHLKDACDINLIIKDIGARGSVDDAAKYGNFADIFDLGGNLQKFRDAELAFSHLPPEIKKKCENNPQGFLKYLTDESNIDQMLQYGLIKDDPRKRLTPEQNAPQATKSGKLKKTTTVVEESSDE